MRRPRQALAVLTFAAIATAQQACGSADGDPTSNPSAGSITLAVGSATMALAGGDSGATTVTIVRSNVSGDVALAIDGVPTGATATFDPQSVAGSAATLKVRLGTSVAAGSYTLVVRGTASGGRSATTTLTLSVTAPTSALAFKSVVTGSSASCALTTTGRAYCWGSNIAGQLGNGTTATASPIPTPVAGGLTFESLSLPPVGSYACGLRTDGAAYCWGYSVVGQIGDGTVDTERLTPIAVVGGLKFVSLSAGGSHTCGLTTDSVAYCWGDNAFGEFGDGGVGGSGSPVLAAPGLRFRALGAAGGSTCGVTVAGAAYCWGLGTTGQLGNGDTATTLTPRAVSSTVAFASISTGGLDACATTVAGEAYCWGYNSFGDVGDGTTVQRVVPTAVGGGLRFTQLRMGFEHACGVVAGGTAYCWGYNGGSIGDGTNTHRSAPTPVLGGLKFQSVSIADFHACGITEIAGGTNDVYCWGNNLVGQLGDGTTVSTTVPRKVHWQ